MSKFFRHISATACIAVATAHAEPMAPADGRLKNKFSSQVNADFLLLADTDDASVVYYVPKRGGIAVDARTSSNPLPRFNISTYVPNFGFFAGETLTRLGGSLSTMANIDALNRLESEAQAKGLTVSPAPATSAVTKFIIGAFVLDDGRLDINCTKTMWKATNSTTGKEIERPVTECKTRSSENAPYDLDVNVMYKFANLPAVGNSVVSQNIPFQAVTLPGVDAELRPLMESGGQWDQYITGRINWEITSQRKTRQARFHINWESVFEQASAFAAYHNNSCVDIEIKGFFQKLTQCKKEDECGIRVEYLQPDGKWGDKAPDNDAFIKAANEVQKKLQDELFAEVSARSKSQLGRVSEKATSQFTLRANYEKILFSKNEVVPFAFNEGPVSVSAATDLNIACLKGGFEQGRVTWDMEDAGCKALIGK
jgi:hypothetical protein